MLKTIDVSEMYKKFDVTHFTFMVITDEDFSCFSKYQKLFKLSDEDIDKLKEEFEKVKILYDEHVGKLPNDMMKPTLSDGQQKDKHDSRLSDDMTKPTLSVDYQESFNYDPNYHGMTISSVFNGIDKEAQRKKVEEIIKRNHAKNGIPYDTDSSFIDESTEESIPYHYMPSFTISCSFDSDLEELQDDVFCGVELIEVNNNKISNNIIPQVTEEVLIKGNMCNDNTPNDNTSRDNTSRDNSPNDKKDPIKQSSFLESIESSDNESSYESTFDDDQYLNNNYPKWRFNGKNNFKITTASVEYIRRIPKFIRSKNFVIYKKVRKSIYDLELYTGEKFKRITDKSIEISDTYERTPMESDSSSFYDSNDKSDKSDNGFRVEYNVEYIDKNGYVLPPEYAKVMSQYKELLALQDANNGVAPPNYNEMIAKLNEELVNIVKAHNERILSGDLPRRKIYYPEEPSIKSEQNKDSKEEPSIIKCHEKKLNFLTLNSIIRHFDSYKLVDFIIAIEIYIDDPQIYQYTEILYNLHDSLDFFDNNIPNYKEGLKTYISMKLGTDKFFNYSLSKKSTIYAKYRKLDIRVPTKVKFKYDPNNKVDFFVMKSERVYPTDYELDLMEENPLYTMFAFYYALSSFDNNSIDYPQEFCPISRYSKKSSISLQAFKYAIETLKLWKNNNIRMKARLLTQRNSKK